MHDSAPVAQQRGFLTPPSNRMLPLCLLLRFCLLSQPVLRGSAPESKAKPLVRLQQHLLRGRLCLQESQATPPKDTNWRRRVCIKFRPFAPTLRPNCKSVCELRPGSKLQQKKSRRMQQRGSAHFGLSKIFPGLRSWEGRVCPRHCGAENTTR